MNRTQRRANRRAEKERQRKETESRDRLKKREKFDHDRDLPASLQKLKLRPVNRGPFDSDYPYDASRTPVIRSFRSRY